ncbi:hypothetical protein SADUNF_Sadunf06G0104100 [Salix dunnii]|uniref:Cyclic nucleotide-binding domain-containing protein n=1 Tax=Salix dunnii TaxID=1413687 RepID=A0A835N2X8_9ROSI|nr:hypothetical protein SADUNF_Sadunf06G0104100 [Salix dunnii]
MKQSVRRRNQYKWCTSHSTKPTHGSLTTSARLHDPVNEMVFIVQGLLSSYSTDGGHPVFLNSYLIGPGIGPLFKCSPYSTRSVIAIIKTEAFALIPEDLKFVASQFRRLNLKSTWHFFRLYSHQWRTWVACFIQAAWFGYIYLKMKVSGELNSTG